MPGGARAGLVGQESDLDGARVARQIVGHEVRPSFLERQEVGSEHVGGIGAQGQTDLPRTMAKHLMEAHDDVRQRRLTSPELGAVLFGRELVDELRAPDPRARIDDTGVDEVLRAVALAQILRRSGGWHRQT